MFICIDCLFWRGFEDDSDEDHFHGWCAECGKSTFAKDDYCPRFVCADCRDCVDCKSFSPLGKDSRKRMFGKCLSGKGRVLETDNRCNTSFEYNGKYPHCRCYPRIIE